MTSNHSPRSAKLARGDWFNYTDRNDFAPDIGSMISTHAFSHRMVEDPQSVDWEKEEWDIESYLVPLDGKRHGSNADVLAAQVRHANYVDFEPWWRSKRRFDFGETRLIGDVTVRPWIQTRIHRISGALIIEPRADFLRYHAADQRLSAVLPAATDYVHPLDDIVICRTLAQRVAYYNPMPFVEVQRDYLLDYLSARRASLLIAVVADRFANAASTADLALELVEDKEIADHTWITTTIHEQSHHNSGNAMGRSSLFWNILVRGYSQPKRSRNPWHLHDERKERGDTEQPVPTFIVDAEGTRRTATDRLSYLYFRPSVLEKYLTTPGYKAGFHMRTWGSATSPHGSVDVGINSRHLLTAFMPDIAKLPVRDQLHWASFSALPDGEVCWAMFETRMQQRPPNQPGVTELISNALDQLQDAIRSRLGIASPLLAETLPDGSGRMSIGPLGADMQEVGTLALLLYSWTIEGLAVSQLRDILIQSGVVPDKQARQLGLLRSLLVRIGKTTSDDAKRIVGPLDALNELRSSAAHRGTVDYQACLARLGLPEMPVGPRNAWDELVNAVAKSLLDIARILK